ncbi:hypothetical protein [Nereida sp. MMG025]|uniref:hypothetical protein n=1 Tax=Nereida sp. MMG025 TaxID=2909981 RepID=UPI001F1D3351|nr:hypothetical protein [Nereida sp. MMG025]MCF6443631.1 hypothetical protein [Nereida sp. MMG025]
MTLLTEVVKKRLAYRRTVAELRAMPRQVGWDLDLFPEDAEKIASRVVYGK